MSFRFVGGQLGLLLMVLSGVIALVGIGSAVAHISGHETEHAACMALLLTAGVGAVLGLALWWIGRGAADRLGRREALLLVAMSWLFGAALSALPFRVWASWARAVPDDHVFRHYVDCYFEAVSGLTTTGATVLTRIGSIPDSLLFWRATMQWLGGLGIIVLFVAVLPSLGVGGKRVFRIELPGPSPEGVRPKIRETARALWLIYVGLSIAAILILRALGMTWFESACHSFASVATGGFSTRDASVAAFHSAAVDAVIIVFMILSSVNFGVYYHAIRGRWRTAWQDPELRVYLGMILVGFLVVGVPLLTHVIHTTTGERIAPSWGTALRYGLFQTVSIQTTAGFCTADFDQWPSVCRTVLVLLMFVGGSAGSTSGGTKVIRCIIVAKVLWSELERVFRPNVVRVVRIGPVAVDSATRLATLAYVFMVFLLFAAGGIALLLLERENGIDVVTALTASATTLNNVGPGLGLVSATSNFAWFSQAGKVVLSLLMVLGRLEVFAIAVLFVPRFWMRE